MSYYFLAFCEFEEKNKFIHYCCYKFDSYIGNHQEEFKYLINLGLIKMASISALFI